MGLALPLLLAAALSQAPVVPAVSLINNSPKILHAEYGSSQRLLYGVAAPVQDEHAKRAFAKHALIGSERANPGFLEDRISHVQGFIPELRLMDEVSVDVARRTFQLFMIDGKVGRHDVSFRYQGLTIRLGRGVGMSYTFSE